jgi:hypothetical protein
MERATGIEPTAAHKSPESIVSIGIEVQIEFRIR